MVCALGLLVGSAVVVGMVVHAVRGGEVPAWAAAIGPLVILVAVRQTFSDLLPGVTPDELAERVASMAPVGMLYAGLGVLAWLAGVGSRLRGHGAPALAQAGALMLAVGLVWTPWAQGEALLWQASTASPDTIESLRSVAGARLGDAATVAALAGALLWGPTFVWGLFRERWRGLGDGVAAGVLVALTLHTGQPARQAVEAAYGAWTATCTHLSVADPSRPFERHPVVRARGCLDRGLR